MAQQDQTTTWTYKSDDDAWISPDGSVEIDGPVIRQLARQVLRTRRTRALTTLESKYGPMTEPTPAYGQAVVDIMSSDWR